MTDNASAFGNFLQTLEAIRSDGTGAITPQHITSWNLQEVADGVLIGTQPYSNGTAFHLSVGPYIQGTSYPATFGAHVTAPNGTKLVWFDWTVGSDEKHKRPHVQFADKRKKRYNISNEEDWGTICTKLKTLENMY